MRIKSININNYHVSGNIEVRFDTPQFLKPLGLEHIRTKLIDSPLVTDSDCRSMLISGGQEEVTAVLEAIHTLISWINAKRLSTNSNGRLIKETDIADGTDYASLDIELKFDIAKHSPEHTDYYEPVYKWTTTAYRKGIKQHPVKNNYDGVKVLANHLAHFIPDYMPVLVYYPSPCRVDKVELSAGNDGDCTIFDCNAESKCPNFNRFFRWFRNREDIENERIRTGEIERNGSDKQIGAVRQAIHSMIPGCAFMTVNRYEDEPPRLMVQSELVHFDYRDVRYEKLDDGVQLDIAQVGDIARRLAIANQKLDIDPLKGEGIIVMDLNRLTPHDKPEKIMAKFMDTFPNCQFIFGYRWLSLGVFNV